ncbi:MAG: hypothetical protein FWG70_00935 [Oscillospiraceae bacterium]|nr:hypothetical protein [Oscillospiraceae bacterium]
MKKHAKAAAAVFSCVLLLSALIFDAKDMTAEIIKAVEVCLYTIIPALFGFMAISTYLLKSGLYRFIFRPLYLIFRHIIRLSEEEFGIFLLSLFGGYPVGAKLISSGSSDMVNKNLLAFCYCPSPGFVISIVGIGIFSNARLGAAVYLSNLISCVLIAVFLNIKNKKITNELKNSSVQLSGDVFISSVLSASSALFTVCAVVVAFGVIGGTLRFLGLRYEFIFAVLEISSAARFAPVLSNLPLLAALFSTGGICILTQINALVSGKFPLKRFFLWRIPAALLSSIICKLIITFFDFTTYVTVSTKNVIIPTNAGNPIASVSLLIMAVILIKTADEKREFN